jgi:hypothetical protein
MDHIQGLFLQEKSFIESFILTRRTDLLAFSLVRFCPFEDLDDLLAWIVNTFAAIGYSFVLCTDSHVVISTRFHAGATATSYPLWARVLITPPNFHPKFPYLLQILIVSAFGSDITRTQAAVVTTESY